VIWSGVVAVIFAYAAAVANRVLKLKLLSRLATQVITVLVPPLTLIFLVLGTIFIGLATPTEGGAMGALGALVLAALNGRLNLTITRQAAEGTLKLAAFVMFILIGARIFSLTFYGVNGHKWVEHLLVSLPGGEVGFLVFVNVLVFLLAFFLDFFELAFIVVPLLKPASEVIFRSSPDAISIAKGLGIAVITTTDATGLVHEEVANITPFVVWFGVLLAVNMQTSFMHPPFGFALFYLRSVAPKEPYADKVTGKRMPAVATSEIYWGAVPFVLIQLAMVAFVLMNPALVMKPVLAPSMRVEMPSAIGATDINSSNQGRFALPPGPPLVLGAPNVPMTGPGAPTLDMSVPPEVLHPSPP